MFTQNLQQEIKHISKYVTETRRYFHANPELSGQEKQTSDYIFQELLKFGIENIIRYDNYGISATITGTSPTPVIGIRADMDALPIHEMNDVVYKSTRQGIMHACGHDAHIAVLLGVAKILQKYRNILKGSVRLIFQPSEETLPGGALQMIENGVLSSPEVSCMLGLHVLPELKSGYLGTRKGEFMASGDEIHLKIEGKGGHAAFPALLNDPLLCAAEIILQIEQKLKTLIPENIQYVCKFGRCIAEGRTNVVPSNVSLEGTFRIFSEQQRMRVHDILQNIIQQNCEKHKTTFSLNIIKGYPVLINDNKLTEQISEDFGANLPSYIVSELPQRMTCDDFAYYTHIVPSCYYRLGVGSKNEENFKGLHTSCFDIDESALVVGVESMISAVFSALQLYS